MEQSQSQLTEANQRLQQENTSMTAAAARPGASTADTDRNPIQEGNKSAVIANLQRDNARLNDEVKRSTRELLSLNQQLRNLRNNPANAATSGTSEADAGQIAQLAAKAQLADEQAQRVEADNRRLTARVAELEKAPRPVTDESLAPQLALARQTTDQLQQQLRTLQGEKAELDKWSASLETTLNEKTASVALLESTVADLRQKAAQQGEDRGQAEAVARLTRENQDLSERLARSAGTRGGDEVGKLQTDLAAASRRVGQLSVTVEELIRTNDQLQKQLEARQDRKPDVAPLRDELAQAQFRIAGLQRDLSLAKQQLDDGAQQLEVANQVVEKSTTTVAELTAANDQMGKDLAAVTRGSVDSSTLRDGLTRARRDLEQTQARVAELEKQLADTLTVRTRGGDDSRKTQADIEEANLTVEKLNATVAELTAANDKLEQDLDNAQRSTAAALAAQSQAVSAASPDAYQMEISTLNARIKQLDAQVEEERANSAREVTTLAAQMQRLRETNKSLTDANRALLSAQNNDTAATRDDIEQLQGRIRELTAASEELRLSGQKQAADLRSLIAERDGLKSELVDAHKVATTLPGLADDKMALQERLEAVGGQLVRLQQTNTELNQQLATSRQANEKAQADLVALQAQAIDADKAAESHNISVAEITQVNARLEQQQEDMQRLVESYRADIARLTQTARTAEQQKAEAERSGQQNIDAVTAQLGQLRRDVEAGRTAQARLTENFAVQDRERAAVITQLRNENSALAARLNQAQGTLDQIASAARLGTPAATLASGGLAPVRPVAPVGTTANEVRFHTVAEGDSLSRISMRYYGTPNRWQEIFQSNRDVLQGSSVLRVGMQLRIP